MSCEDLCRKAGFDITTKDFWNSGIKMYEQEVNIFAEYVNGRA
jgi:oligoendopeptidase F